jgi:kynurenine formamidase
VTDGIASVDELLAKVSNRGRWGEADELGTLHHLTEARTLAALRLPTSGRTVHLGRSMGPRPGWPGDAPLQHHMLTAGSESPAHGEYVLADWFGIQPHGLSITHLDALNHLTWHGRLYNGRPAGSVTAARGGAVGSAELTARGIVTRGVLLDVPRALGLDWVDPADPITPDQLAACGVEVRPGDAVLVRTGRDPRVARQNEHGLPSTDLAGLDLACLPWLAERDVALLGSDSAHDRVPAVFADVATPVHVVALVGLGMWLLDNLILEDLAALGATEFLFCLAPIALKNSTGVPVNPLAVL